jgi:hypothetical protein
VIDHGSIFAIVASKAAFSVVMAWRFTCSSAGKTMYVSSVIWILSTPQHRRVCWNFEDLLFLKKTRGFKFFC